MLCVLIRIAISRQSNEHTTNHFQYKKKITQNYPKYSNKLVNLSFIRHRIIYLSEYDLFKNKEKQFGRFTFELLRHQTIISVHNK